MLLKQIYINIFFIFYRIKFILSLSTLFQAGKKLLNNY